MNTALPPPSHTDVLRHYIEERQISDSLEDELLGFQGAERDIVCALITFLRPSANTLRELLNLISEICQRDGLSWTDLFSDPVAHTVIDEQVKLNGKERHRELKNYLTRLRFPETSRLQDELEEYRKRVAKDCSLALKLPDNLEGEALEVKLQFSDCDELAEQVKRLQALASHPALEKIFKVLKGIS